MTKRVDVERCKDWNKKAEEWNQYMGLDGDSNRKMNSEKVLWRMLGAISGKQILDVGCGNGYLSIKLYEKGGNVTGVDVSDEMIRYANQNAKEQQANIVFRVDSAQTLDTLGDEVFHKVVSNYVLMDLPDLEAALSAICRVLKPKGIAVLIFSHPCFPQHTAQVDHQKENVSYRWDYPYFENSRQVCEPWANFTSQFTFYHRPLSCYWKAFNKYGFSVEEFDEPHWEGEKIDLDENEILRLKPLWRPCSVAFRLRKKD